MQATRRTTLPDTFGSGIGAGWLLYLARAGEHSLEEAVDREAASFGSNVVQTLRTARETRGGES